MKDINLLKISPHKLKEEETLRPQDIEGIMIRLTSPEEILEWSYGEVKKPDTINYRTQRPERDGLFCERIFGPVRDYECSCGKYKGLKYRGTVCERCKVEVTSSRVRRERMGHITLAAPVAHIWFYKIPPSRMGLLLDMSVKDLERIIYYEAYVVLDPSNTGLTRGQIITEEEYQEIMKHKPAHFRAGMGAEALDELLRELDLNEMAIDLRTLIMHETSESKRKKLLKKLQVVEAFRESKIRPEWMILKVLPVIPPDLRILVPLEGGRYATSDLNNLYKRVITRNNRLKNLLEYRAPEVVIKNEKRMLQEAVDALLDNARKERPVLGRGNRPLKSLTDNLRGKQGRFRRNLLGKRVDYSGRAVIVVGPKLKLYECGLPKKMAIELFRPFIIYELHKRGIAPTIRQARNMIDDREDIVWEILEDVVKNYPVWLNRAPTLHRVSIQAFYPKLIEGEAIQLHPLVCPPYNADFDGDQMAVHVPLSFEAQIESHTLMLAPNNLLSPAHGDPLTVPTRDIVLGIYWLTGEKPGVKGEGGYFDTLEEIENAVYHGSIDIHARIKYKWEGEWIETTPGRVIFNSLLPKGMPYVNEVVDAKKLAEIEKEVILKYGTDVATEFLDKVKEIGFEYATISGITLGVDDMIRIPEKQKIIEEALREIEAIERDYREGRITESERYNHVIDAWSKVQETIETKTVEMLSRDQEGFNPFYMMALSGARGRIDQVRQIVGMRGLMERPRRRATGGTGGETIEVPILSSLSEGLNVLEYFISTYGARKGQTDTALKTAESGYLTRKLVDVAQDVIVREEDCGTTKGIEITAIKEGEEIIEPLSERIKGRIALEDIVDPYTNEVLVHANEEISDKKAIEIEKRGIEKVLVRSPLTCETKYGVCRKCYGRDFATGKLVRLGEAVGIVAAQSIGEPGTQLTLRTFHTGGAAARMAAESEKTAPFDGVVRLKDVRTGVRKDGVKIVLSREGKMKVESKKHGVREFSIPYGAALNVKDGERVKEGNRLFEWDPYAFSILAEAKGIVKFEGFMENVTYRLEYDERTQRKQPVIIEHRRVHPKVLIMQGNKVVQEMYMPRSAYIFVKEGEHVVPGDLIAKVPTSISRAWDITGGLPRVVELFEARKPDDPAVISEIDGWVRFDKPQKDAWVIVVQGHGMERKYRIPYEKYLLVWEGREVKAGEKLCVGDINPHDILRAKGVLAVQEFLLQEIQKVYRLQKVRINDKHIEIIIRQMLSKVEIIDPGDTKFIREEIVDRVKVEEENNRIEKMGGRRATFRPLLLGISRASLVTESFISAASFQETAHVLADAAIRGKLDELRGIKENVIVGNLIPAGTGALQFREIEVAPPSVKELEREEVKSEALDDDSKDK